MDVMILMVILMALYIVVVMNHVQTVIFMLKEQVIVAIEDSPIPEAQEYRPRYLENKPIPLVLDCLGYRDQ